jgi:proline iminopeptidase
MPALAAVRGAQVYALMQQTFFSEPYDLYPAMRSLHSIPTLILHGDFDSIPPVTAQCVCDSIPGSRYVLIDRCGHFPYVEAPDIYFREILRFLGGCS